MISQAPRLPPTFRVVLVCIVLLLHCASSGRAAQRLNGGFFQYNSELAAWPSNNWFRVLDKMRELGMDTVIIQMTAQEMPNGQTRSFIASPGGTDPTEAILDYADANGFNVYIGLYASQWLGSMTESNFLARITRENQAAADRVYARYLAGKARPSFAGWYLPYEPWTAEYSPAEISRLRGFFSTVQQHCANISGNGVLAISPFISAQRASPCRVEQLYAGLLTNSGISILMLQDSVGAQSWVLDIPQRVRPYAEAFQRACTTNGVRFWANIESFRIEDFSPCDPARLRRQFDAMGSLPERFITFDFVHYMNPAVFLNSWGQERRDRMRTLYEAYRNDFVLQEYPPLSNLLLQTGNVNGQLSLHWRAEPGEEYRVETTADLARPAWQTTTAVVHHAQSISSVLISPGAQTAQFFRVIRTARLELPDSMVHVPAGEFTMGKRPGDTNSTSSELPPFIVRITRDFWISDHEVTQSEYLNIMCANQSASRGDLELPAESMAWNDAVLYCTRITAAERAAGRLPSGYEYRLPTEAEWEYAARAGSTGIFSYGDDRAALTNYAWTSLNSAGQLRRGRMLLPNAWGVFDCQGNVYEWCLDWLGDEPITGPMDDPRGSLDSSYRAARGGSFSTLWSLARLSSRMMFAPSRRASNLGFRVVVAETRSDPSGIG